jgi:hypothetical protein
MLCYGFLNKQSPLTPCGSDSSQSMSQSMITKYGAIPHSTKHDTQPITFLISKQAVPYWTHGGTCCPGVSTPKIWSLADPSMTNHIT